MAGRSGDAFATFRDQLVEGLAKLLLDRRLDMVHAHPEIAVRLGLRSVLGVIDGEARSSERLERATLIAECRSLLVAYLTDDTESKPSGEGVDFFEVWG